MMLSLRGLIPPPFLGRAIFNFLKQVFLILPLRPTHTPLLDHPLTITPPILFFFSSLSIPHSLIHPLSLPLIFFFFLSSLSGTAY